MSPPTHRIIIIILLFAISAVVKSHFHQCAFNLFRQILILFLFCVHAFGTIRYQIENLSCRLLFSLFNPIVTMTICHVCVCVSVFVYRLCSFPHLNSMSHPETICHSIFVKSFRFGFSVFLSLSFRSLSLSRRFSCSFSLRWNGKVLHSAHCLSAILVNKPIWRQLK